MSPLRMQNWRPSPRSPFSTLQLVTVKKSNAPYDNSQPNPAMIKNACIAITYLILHFGTPHPHMVQWLLQTGNKCTYISVYWMKAKASQTRFFQIDRWKWSRDLKMRKIGIWKWGDGFHSFQKYFDVNLSRITCLTRMRLEWTTFVFCKRIN